MLAEAVAGVPADGLRSLYSIAAQLREVLESADDQLLWMIWAFEYDAVPFERADRRAQWGAFAPIGEWDGGAYPPPLDEIANEALGVWERASRLAVNSSVRARCLDLLWVRRFGERPFESAQRAIDCYLEAAEDNWLGDLDLRDGLIRSLELATELNDTMRQLRAVDALVRLIDTRLHAAEPAPGVILPAIETLAALRVERRPSELESLIERAVVHFRKDPWNLQAALDVKAKFVEPENRAALHEEQVQGFVNVAAEAEGLTRLAFLREGLELAVEHGLTDLARSIRIEIETISPDELGLQRISAEIELPMAEVDGHIAWIVGSDTLAEALTRLGAQLPSGELDKNLETVRELAMAYPIQHIFPTLTLGASNSVLREAVTPQEREEHALVQHEVMQIQFFSTMFVEAIRGIVDKYPTPREELVRFFTTDLIDEIAADRIARAFELYVAGDPDSCASVLAPRLERIIRTMVRRCGIPITKSAERRTGRPGGVRSLGELLQELHGRLDESRRRYLRALLSEITAINLRNRVSHGLLDCATEREAALLLQAACLLRLLNPSPSQVDADEAVDASGA